VRLTSTLVLITLALVLSACSGTRGGSIGYNPTHFGAPDAPPLAETSTEYHLAAGDTVTVHVFNVDSVSGDYQLDSAGRISVPLIGNVPAAGETTDSLTVILTRQLGAKYLASPQVNVTLKTATQKTVTVDGSVVAPGVYPVAGKATLIQIIAIARGTSEGANPKRVVVFRQIDGQREAAAFDLTTIRRGTDADPAIFAGDIVVVDGNNISAGWKTVLQTIPLVALFARF
jgi:polysaccharide export outer membrane protein